MTSLIINVQKTTCFKFQKSLKISILLTKYLLCLYSLNFFLISPNVLALSMKPEDYRSLIEKRCFNETVYHEQYVRGQWHPVGSSIDYLIRLIEKIEYHVSDPKILLPMLLRRFHYDGTKQQSFRNFQMIPDYNQRKINERIFSSVPITQSFPENILFEDEKCAMFFMLSHTINDTRPRKWTNSNNLFTGNEEIDLDDEPYPRREVGSVSWLSSSSIAISTPPLLLGLAVGLFRPANFSFSDSLPAEIDPLIAVTFADKLAVASLVSMTEYRNLPLFGMEGKWNSSYCHTEFQLDENKDRGANVTMAELNGSIIGWLIGRKLLYEPDTTSLRKLSLSQILRRFFTKLGISLDCGICSQDLLTPQLQQDIRENSIKYILQWNKIFSFDNVEYERLVNFVEYNQISYWAHIQKASSIMIEECLRTYSTIYGNSECETTSDIFIMIDNIATYEIFQLEFMKRLLTRIQASNYLGHITIMVNALRSIETDLVGKLSQDLKIPLHLLIYNTSSIQEATCRTAWYRWRESTINDKKLLLEYLVTFFERHNITNPRPNIARNFFWINLQQRPYKLGAEMDRILMNQYRWYLKYYLNLRTFFISSNDIKTDDNDIIDILLNKDDRIQVNPSNLHDDQTVARLAKRVCETPIPLIYEKCNLNSQKRSNWINSTSFITPHRKQYWAIYPKHFFNSPLVKLKFLALGAKIRVCLHRYLRPESDNSKCLDAKQNGDTVSFAIATPCKWKRVDNCLPIYFTVFIANKALLTPNDCIDDNCRGLEQIVWQISHYGLECTGNYRLYKHLASQYTLSSSSLIFPQRYSLLSVIISAIIGIIWQVNNHFSHS